MFKHTSLLAIVALALFLPGFRGVAAAEELEEGSTEVLGFAGFATDNLGAAFGGGIQHAFRPRWLLSAEFGLFTVEESDFGTIDIDTSAWAFDANAHYLFPLEQNERFTPYVLGGLNITRISVDGSVPGFSVSAGDTNVGLNVGGGARWKLGDNWGLRPEVKFTIADGSYSRVSLGIYYRF